MSNVTCAPDPFTGIYAKISDLLTHQLCVIGKADYYKFFVILFDHINKEYYIVRISDLIKLKNDSDINKSNRNQCINNIKEFYILNRLSILSRIDCSKENESDKLLLDDTTIEPLWRTYNSDLIYLLVVLSLIETIIDPDLPNASIINIVIQHQVVQNVVNPFIQACSNFVKSIRVSIVAKYLKRLTSTNDLRFADKIVEYLAVLSDFDVTIKIYIFKIIFYKVLKIAKYGFDEKEFIFHTTTEAYQQYFGYYDFYDIHANDLPLFRIDCLKIPICIDGIRYNIRAWKGNYWGAAGAEIGFYTGDGPLKNIGNSLSGLILDNVEQAKQIVQNAKTLLSAKWRNIFNENATDAAKKDLFLIGSVLRHLIRLDALDRDLSILFDSLVNNNIENAKKLLIKLQPIINEEASMSSTDNMLKMSFVLEDLLGRKVFSRFEELNWWIIGLKPLENFSLKLLDTGFWWKDMQGKYRLKGTIDFNGSRILAPVDKSKMTNEFIKGLIAAGFTEDSSLIKDDSFCYNRRDNKVMFNWFKKGTKYWESSGYR